MEFIYTQNPADWVNKGIEELLEVHGRPFKRSHSPDGSADADVLQDLLDMHDPDFMLEHTRQHKDGGVLLVDEKDYEYFESLMTQVMRADDNHAEMNRLHHEVGDDPAADPLWEVYEGRVQAVSRTAKYIKERPADTLEVLNFVCDKYTTALQDYLAKREGLE